MKARVQFDPLSYFNGFPILSLKCRTISQLGNLSFCYSFRQASNNMGLRRGANFILIRNLSAEEMVHRFWQGTIAGAHVGHGETYRHPESVIWWARGGELHGKSPSRIAFLRKILEEGPLSAWEPIDKWQDYRTAGKKGEFYFVYFGKETPSEWKLNLPFACGAFSNPALFQFAIIPGGQASTGPIVPQVASFQIGKPLNVTA